MRILFINNDGGGFADTLEIPDGTTVAELFAQRREPGSQNLSTAGRRVRLASTRLASSAERSLGRVLVTPGYLGNTAGFVRPILAVNRLLFRVQFPG